MKKSLSLLAVTLIFNSAFGQANAAQTTTIFEENHTAWQYTGYWRNSNQGQYGSGSQYAVGNSAQTQSNSYSGESGGGLAYLDLTSLPESTLQIELCYIAHGNSWRSTNTIANIHFSDSSAQEITFSQVGSTNTQQCYMLGSHDNVTAVSVSNTNSDDKWVSLDYVRVNYSESPTTDTGEKQRFISTYEPGDLIPNKPMGEVLQRSVYIDGASTLGLNYPTGNNVRVNFGKLIVPLDDIDGNGIRELFVSVDDYVTTYSSVTGIIVYPDSNGNILKHQAIDGRMTKDTSWYPDYVPQFAMSAGDFDSNGVKDIVLSQYINTFGESRLNVLLFGRTDSTSAAEYTIKGDVELSNNRGKLPFTSVRYNQFGIWGHAVGDIDGNGTGDFWSLLFNQTDDIRPDLNTNILHTTISMKNDGSVLSMAADTLPLRSSNQKIIGDINHDGIPDLVMQESTADQRNFYLTTLVSNGSSNSYNKQTTQLLKEGFDNHMRVTNSTAIGDVNGDGHLDVLVSAYPDFTDLSSSGITMEIVYLDAWGQQLGNPVTLFNKVEFFNAAFGVFSPAVLDMDGDGDLDLVMPAPKSDGGGFYFMYFE